MHHRILLPRATQVKKLQGQAGILGGDKQWQDRYLVAFRKARNLKYFNSVPADMSADPGRFMPGGRMTDYYSHENHVEMVPGLCILDSGYN